MINNHEQHTEHLGQQPQRLLRHEVESRLANEVECLLSHTNEEQLRWNGTRSDLMEALYVVFCTGLLEDDEGCQLHFSHIVSRACSLLHVVPPRNPYETAARARRRKGLNRSTFMRRYELRLCRQEKTPFLRQIIR